jgi:RNA polymerase sigma-70 factor, ECF subfamily
MSLDGAQTAELARRAAQGEPAAFRALIEETQALVYRVALRLVGNSADAEDVVQETYVRAWQKLPSMRDHGAVVGWLCSITRNVSKDKLRAHKSRPSMFSDEEAARIAIEKLTSDAPDAAALASSKETAAVVQAAVNELDEKYRLALLLKDVDGLTAPEIAAALDIPVGTVESRASRAREQLGKKLRKLVQKGKL